MSWDRRTWDTQRPNHGIPILVVPILSFPILIAYVIRRCRPSGPPFPRSTGRLVNSHFAICILQFSLHVLFVGGAGLARPFPGVPGRVGETRLLRGRGQKTYRRLRRQLNTCPSRLCAELYAPQENTPLRGGRGKDATGLWLRRAPLSLIRPVPYGPLQRTQSAICRQWPRVEDPVRRRRPYE